LDATKEEFVACSPAIVKLGKRYINLSNANDVVVRTVGGQIELEIYWPGETSNSSTITGEDVQVVIDALDQLADEFRRRAL
jgi:hypothetical protein